MVPAVYSAQEIDSLRPAASAEQRSLLLILRFDLPQLLLECLPLVRIQVWKLQPAPVQGCLPAAEAVWRVVGEPLKRLVDVRCDGLMLGAEVGQCPDRRFGPDTECGQPDEVISSGWACPEGTARF